MNLFKYLNFSIHVIDRQSIMSWSLFYLLYYHFSMIMVLPARPPGFTNWEMILLHYMLMVGVITVQLTCLYYMEKSRFLQKLIVCSSAIAITLILLTYLWIAITKVHTLDYYQRTGGMNGPLVTFLLYGLFPFWLAAYYDTIKQAKSKLNAEKIKNIELQKRITQSQFMMLQAQIEPHFLFNTLANILALYEIDTEKGKKMQADLIRYIKESLPQVSSGKMVTIGQEMDLTRAYLDIFKVRMGRRLTYEIDLPQPLCSHPFPAMLIQPLVENSIKHGLEPKIEGGAIYIHVSQHDDILQIKIKDTGLGMTKSSSTSTGLKNIQNKLQTIYGDQALLFFQENKPNGSIAIVEVPYEKQKGT